MALAEAALTEGRCVVVGLQSTGEAATEEARQQAGGQLDDFVSAPRVPPPTHGLASWGKMEWRSERRQGASRNANPEPIRRVRGLRWGGGVER